MCKRVYIWYQAVRLELPRTIHTQATALPPRIKQKKMQKATLEEDVGGCAITRIAWHPPHVVDPWLSSTMTNEK